MFVCVCVCELPKYYTKMDTDRGPVIRRTWTKKNSDFSKVRANI